MLAEGPGNDRRSTPDDRRLGGWLLVLALLLVAGEPLGLAFMAARLLPTLAARGGIVLALLVLRVLVTAFGVAAGLALLDRRPHAIGLTKLALLPLGAVSVLSPLAPVLPSNLPPDLRAPLALLAGAYYLAWLAYLHRSRRVRRTFE